jgi:hypothetical protein
MRVALDVVEFAIGVTLVLITMTSAIKSTILPRAANNRLVSVVAAAVQLLFRLRLRRATSYERRDGAMALLGPVTLISLLGTWILLLLVAYALMFVAIGTSSLRRAIELSGSSVTTIGTAGSTRFVTQLLTYSEAGLGLVLLTLLITYLPSIYGAFSRREKGVSLLAVRAGTPPRATTMLIRYHRIEEFNFRLTELWRSWESWFVDVEESHTSFPILAVFRSPRPDESWINSAGVLLDAASLWVSSVEHPSDPDAQLCIRAGFLTLRRIASSFGLRYDADPPADGPITIGREEFESALDEMADAGLDLAPDRDAAWTAFSGWRVNYDTVLLNLARMVEAPVAPWVSDRSPLRPEQVYSLRQTLTAQLAVDSRSSRRALRRHGP